MKSNIQDKLIEIYDRDNWTCQRCGKPATQIAHRIAKTKANKKYIQKRYGLGNVDIIIHNKLNLVAVCSLECNSSYNIGNNPVETNKLLEKIVDKI